VGAAPTGFMEGLRMACRTGCLTKDHSSYGDCLRGASLRIGYAKSASGLDATSERRKETELSLYRDARAAGIQPATTRTPDIRRAFELSEKAGAAFDATDNTFNNGAHYSPKTGQVVKFD
jgi:hypothetical protein